MTITVTGPSSLIAGKTVKDVAPSDGEVLFYSASEGEWDPTGAYVPAAHAQNGSPDVQWTVTPSNPQSPGPYQSAFGTQTTSGVTYTTWSLGYNWPNRVASQVSGFIKFYPNPGDTNSLEFSYEGVFPDGSGFGGVQHQASNTGNDATKWVFTFYPGSDHSGYFLIQDNSGNQYLSLTAPGGTPQAAFAVSNFEVTGAGAALSVSPSSGSGTVDIYAQGSSYANLMLKPLGTGGATLTLDSPTGGGPNAVHFQRNNSDAWLIYDAGSSSLFVRDSVNGVMTLELDPGAGANGKVALGSVLFPVQAATISAPNYVKGGLYFDTTLNKLRVGGATAWETVTSS